jgi:hypothetical protein
MSFKSGRKKTGGRKKRVRSDYELQLHKNITERKRIDGTPYSPSAVDNYVNNLEKLSRSFVGKDETMSDLKWLEEGKDVITFLDTTTTNQGNNYSVETKLSICQAILVGLKTEGYGSDDENLEPFMKLYYDKRALLKTQKEGMIAQNDTSGTITSKNSLKVMNEVEEKDIFTMIDRMNKDAFKDGELVNRKVFMIATLLAVHTEFPFRNDLADVKIIGRKLYEEKVKSGEDKETNWLLLDKKDFRFILNNFKTKSLKPDNYKQRYDVIVGDVESPLVKTQLNRWIKLGHVGDEINDTFLLSNEDGRKLTRNNISVLLTNETPKEKYGNKGRISTTLLVKIFNDLPQDYRDIKPEDIVKMKKKAYLRGHKTSTRIGIYAKKRSM